MNVRFLRRLGKVVKNSPNLINGYNIYVNRDKLRLIEKTFSSFCPQARSFADLGGVWKVNGAYALHTLRKFQISRGLIIDTDIPKRVLRKLSSYPGLEIITGDFADKSVLERIGFVDVVYLFDVLLHQANPDWDEVLGYYAGKCKCFVIYNQQFIRGDKTIRLTDLPLREYIQLASDHREDLTRFIYDHKYEIHPQYKKPWKDIHNITQWGITDASLREAMNSLGYQEVYFRNFGMFIDLPAFENHAFVFSRK